MVAVANHHLFYANAYDKLKIIIIYVNTKFDKNFSFFILYKDRL